MTIEELLAALQALLDQAKNEGRELTEEEVERAEDLERQVAVIQRSQLVQARVAALQATDTSTLRGVVAGTGNPAGAGLYGTERTGPTAADKETLARAFDIYTRTGHVEPEMTHYRAQGTGTDSAGGYLVPEEFRQKLVDRVVTFGGVAEDAETFTTSTGAPVDFPTLDDTANSGEIVAEHAAPAGGADLVFGSKELGSYTYQAPGAGANPLRVSVELAQDSAFNIQDLVQRKLAQRIARIQAVHWVNGTGTGQPEGITASTGPSSTFTGAALTYAALVAAKHTIDPEYRKGAKWYFNDQTLAKLESLVDNDGRPLLQPAASSGLAGDGGMTLLNHPIQIDQAFEDYTDASSNNWGAFGNMREAYVIRRVRDVQLIVNPYSRANNREIEYTLWARADGAVQNPYAISILKNDAA
jgi:HK97 family phage major capsid protein